MIHQLCDCHAHLDLFAPDRLTLLAEEWRVAGIERVLAAGEDLERSRRAIEIARARVDVDACVGLHPWRVHLVPPETVSLEPFRALASDPAVVAISEIGPDENVTASRSQQRQVLAWFLALAGTISKPVILHCMTSAAALLDVWDQVDKPPPAAAIHSYCGTLADAATLLDRGFLLSLGPASLGLLGPDVLERAETGIARAIPLDRLLVDSDAYPASDAEAETSPVIVADVIEAIAAERGMRPQKIADAVRVNLDRLFAAGA